MRILCIHDTVGDRAMQRVARDSQMPRYKRRRSAKPSPISRGTSYSMVASGSVAPLGLMSDGDHASCSVVPGEGEGELGQSRVRLLRRRGGVRWRVWLLPGPWRRGWLGGFLRRRLCCRRGIVWRFRGLGEIGPRWLLTACTAESSAARRLSWPTGGPRFRRRSGSAPVRRPRAACGPPGSP